MGKRKRETPITYRLRTPDEAQAYLRSCVQRMPAQFWRRYDGWLVDGVLTQLATNAHVMPPSMSALSDRVRNSLDDPFLPDADVWAYLIHTSGDVGESTEKKLIKKKWGEKLRGHNCDHETQATLMQEILQPLRTPKESDFDRLERIQLYFRDVVLGLKVSMVREPDDPQNPGITFGFDPPLKLVQMPYLVRLSLRARHEAEVQEGEAQRDLTSPPDSPTEPLRNWRVTESASSPHGLSCKVMTPVRPATRSVTRAKKQCTEQAERTK